MFDRKGPKVHSIFFALRYTPSFAVALGPSWTSLVSCIYVQTSKEQIWSKRTILRERIHTISRCWSSYIELHYSLKERRKKDRKIKKNDGKMKEVLQQGPWIV